MTQRQVESQLTSQPGYEQATAFRAVSLAGCLDAALPQNPRPAGGVQLHQQSVCCIKTEAKQPAPHLYALPLIAFSTAGTSTLSLTGSCADMMTCASASTRAAPPMSCWVLGQRHTALQMKSSTPKLSRCAYSFVLPHAQLFPALPTQTHRRTYLLHQLHSSSRFDVQT